MATLIFRLDGVPDDEAAEVRELLSRNDIEYYETDSGRWRISVGALWLRDDGQAAAARDLIEEYQVERGARMRAEHERQRLAGEHPTLRGRLFRHPLQFLLYVAAIGAVLYFSLAPFLRHW